MTDIRAGTIVPSTRDLLQALSRRRKALALVPLLLPERAAEDAAHLDAANAPAFAMEAPGPAMVAAARATRSIPMLSLALAEAADDALFARQHGADGACAPLAAWADVSAAIKSTRMAPLALVTSIDACKQAVAAGAKGIVIRAGSVREAASIAAAAPRGPAIVVWADDLDETSARALVGVADAAIVPASLYASTSFASLIEEVDP